MICIFLYNYFCFFLFCYNITILIINNNNNDELFEIILLLETYI